MTNDEAIKVLNTIFLTINYKIELPQTKEEINEALGLAIASLANKKASIWIVKQDERGKTYGECARCGMKNYAGATMYCPDCGAFTDGKFEEEK